MMFWRVLPEKKCLVSKYVESFDSNRALSFFISVFPHSSISQLTIRIVILFLARVTLAKRLNMNFHYKYKIQTACKNIYSFICKYKGLNVNKFHRSSVTRHTHFA